MSKKTARRQKRKGGQNRGGKDGGKDSGNNDNVRYEAPIPNVTYFREVLGSKFDKTLEERGIKKGVGVRLFTVKEGAAVLAGTARLGTAGDTNAQVQRKLYLHELPNNMSENLVVITGTKIYEEAKYMPYPYTFEGGEGPPSNLGDIYPAGCYAWEARLMVPIADDSVLVKGPPPAEKGSHTRSGEDLSIPPRKRLKTNLVREGRKHSQPSQSLRIAVLNQSQEMDEDEVVEVAAPNELADRRRQVEPRQYRPSAYFTLEAKVNLGKLIEPPETLRDFSTAHSTDLVKLFKDIGYDYSQGMMTITVRREDNDGLKDLKLSTLLRDLEEEDVKGNKVISRQLDPRLSAMIIDGLHRKRSFSDVLKDIGRHPGFEWLKIPIRMSIMLRQDGIDMSLTEILQQSSRKNTASGLVRVFKGLESHIHAGLSYLESFAREWNLSTDEIRPSDLTEELYAAHYFPGLEKASYTRYARIAKLFAKFPRAWTLLQKLKPDDKPVIGAIHLDHSAWFQVDEQGVLLFLQGVHSYVRNAASEGKFMPTPFFHCTLDLYQKTKMLYNAYAKDLQVSFPDFLKIEISQSKGITISIRDFFTNQMRLFSVKDKAASTKNRQRITRFVSRIRSHFEQMIRKRGEGNATTVPHGPVAAQPSTNLRTGAPSTRNVGNRSTTNKTGKSAQVDVGNLDIIDEDNKEKLDEEGYRIPEPESKVQLFDDKIPNLLPVGGEAPEYEADTHHWWHHALAAPPSLAEVIIKGAKERGDDVERHPTPWLSAVHIRPEHRANIFMTVPEIFFAFRMAWLKGAKKRLEWDKKENPMIRNHLPSASWEVAAASFTTGESALYFARQGALLRERGYCILEGFAEDSDVPDHVREHLGPPATLQQFSVQDICRHYIATFPGEGELKDEKKRKLWNPVVNLGEEQGDRKHRDEGRARYTSTCLLLTSEPEQDMVSQWAANARARLDAWLGQLAVLLGLTNNGDEKMWAPETGGSFLITGRNCPRQAPHNDFQVPHRKDKEKLPGYFIIVCGNDPFPLWFCKYSHHFVFNPLKDLHRIASALKLDKLIIPSRSVFFGHGYATHAGAGSECRVVEERTTRYHLYLIPDNKRPPDSLFYAFGTEPRFADMGWPKQAKRKRVREDSEKEMADTPRNNDSKNQSDQANPDEKRKDSTDEDGEKFVNRSDESEQDR